MWWPARIAQCRCESLSKKWRDNLSDVDLLPVVIAERSNQPIDVLQILVGENHKPPDPIVLMTVKPNRIVRDFLKGPPSPSPASTGATTNEHNNNKKEGKETSQIEKAYQASMNELYRVVQQESHRLAEELDSDDEDFDLKWYDDGVDDAASVAAASSSANEARMNRQRVSWYPEEDNNNNNNGGGKPRRSSSSSSRAASKARGARAAAGKETPAVQEPARTASTVERPSAWAGTHQPTTESDAEERWQVEANDNRDQASLSNVSEPPRVYGESIEPNDTWDVVWGKLEYSEWFVSQVGDTGRRYTKPGRDACGVEGVDYFTSVEDVQEYARKHYGWKGGAEQQKQAKNNDSGTPDELATTPTDQRTRPQDPGKPLLSSPDDSPVGRNRPSMESTYTREEDRYVWTVLWNRLKYEGWTYANGTGLHSFYYVRPGKSVKTGTFGLDYFADEGEVIKYAKTIDGYVDRSSDNGSAASKKRRKKKMAQEKKNARAANKLQKKKSRQKQKPVKATVPKSASRKTSSEKKTLKDLPKSVSRPKLSSRWYLSPRKFVNPCEFPIPSRCDVEPILKKAGYILPEDDEGAFYFPDSVYTEFEVSPDKAHFQSLAGLRKFVCAYGYPLLEETTADLTDDEYGTLVDWARFANVPVSGRNTAKALSQVPYPKNDDAISRVLIDLGCLSSGDGRIHFPYEAHLPFSSHERQHGVHYFHWSDLKIGIRLHFRGKYHIYQLLEQQRRKEDDIFESREVVSSAPAISSKEMGLRLWAAMSDLRLPVFKSFPSKAELEVLVDLRGEPEEEGDIEEEMEDASSLDQSSAGESDENSDVDVVGANEDDDSETEFDFNKSCDDDISSVSDHSAISPTPEKKRKGKHPVSSGPAKKAKQDIAIPSLDEVPSTAEVWPVLSKLGYFVSPHRSFCFPSSIYDTLGQGSGKFKFRSLVGLRLFLCAYGLPRVPGVRLSKKEEEVLDLWARYTNLPDKHGKMSPLPKNKTQLKDFLKSAGFTASMEQIYFPCSVESRRMYGKREHGKHYVMDNDSEIYSVLRPYLRGKWLADMHRLQKNDGDPEWDNSHDRLLESLSPKELALCGWGATTTLGLPELTEFPPEDDVSVLFDLQERENEGDLFIFNDVVTSPQVVNRGGLLVQDSPESLVSVGPPPSPFRSIWPLLQYVVAWLISNDLNFGKFVLYVSSF